MSNPYNSHEKLVIACALEPNQALLNAIALIDTANEILQIIRLQTLSLEEKEY